MTLHQMPPTPAAEFPHGPRPITGDAAPMSPAQAISQMVAKLAPFVFVACMILNGYPSSEALMTASGCMVIAFGMSITSGAGKKAAKKFAAGFKGTVN
jgi:hypothetical protein